VYLGRRPLPADLPPGVTRVVDLCVEFPGTAAPASVSYITLPTLDAGLADPDTFRSLVAEVAADDSPVYVHCASGHGRGAMFAAALLVARGMAPDVGSAETMIRTVRPGVRLSRSQRDFVRRMMTPSLQPRVRQT
jgi:protein-tyrosine phosphatase